MKRTPLRRAQPPSLAVKVFRPRQCKAPGCKNTFTPRDSMQKWCCFDCAAALGMQALLKRDKRTAAIKAKEERADLRRRKERAKTKSDWRREAQAAFNAFIRLRDAALPCISCGRHHEGQWHAGHYLSTGARPELRFDEANCHKQCQPCNTHLHGNLVLYRLALIRKIGQADLERLEGPAAPCHLKADDLKKIRDHYRAKVRAMKKGK